ncbi:MAG: fibronectin type III domain-containing protein, partial [Rhodothermales bacterium]|nr:fibronectin type III domain-containing protein [Rhodothermales bacterium]
MKALTLLLVLALAPTAALAQEFALPIGISNDTVTLPDSPVIGMSTSATDTGSDGQDVIYPPLPPGGFYAYLQAPDGRNLLEDYRLSPPATSPTVYTLIYSSNDGPVQLSWDNAILNASGMTFTITDGDDFSQDMNSTTSLDTSVDPTLAFGLYIEAIPGAPPAGPANVSAVAESSSSIGLSWDDTSTETGYRVQREFGTGLWGVVAEPGQDATSYTDSGLSVDTEYCYRVFALNAFGQSAPSPTVCATTAVALSASPSVVAFTLDEGPNADTAPFTVSASDATTPTVALAAVDDDTGSAPTWLTVPATVTAGTAADADVDASGLPAGSYAATVTATAAGYLTTTLAVTLEVEAVTGCSPTWSASLTLTDGDGEARALELGTRPGASDDYDPGCDAVSPGYQGD